MPFDSESLIQRFKIWCYSTLDQMKQMPQTVENRVFLNQCIRSSTSSYMNYRAACRAKSTADMIYKLKIVEEELDESIGWLDISQERNKLNFSNEIKEGGELLAITVTSIKTLKGKSVK